MTAQTLYKTVSVKQRQKHSGVKTAGNLRSGVGVRLKVGINIEKIEGVGSGRGSALPSLGSGGLPPEKKNFALKILQF